MNVASKRKQLRTRGACLDTDCQLKSHLRQI